MAAVSPSASLIPIGLSSEQYKAIGDIIQLSSQNATQAINGETQTLLGISGGLGAQVPGGTSGPSGAAAPTTTPAATPTNPNDPLNILP